jgi:hypothetical protein
VVVGDGGGSQRILDQMEGDDDSSAGRAPGYAAGNDDAESTVGVCWTTSGGDDKERTTDVAISTAGRSLLMPASLT